MAKKVKKSTWIISALLIYNTLVGLYFLVYLDRPNTKEEYLTIFFGYVIIIILGFVLRRKERLKQRREEDLKNSQKNTSDDSIESH